jgi:hypothetical protein
MKFCPECGEKRFEESKFCHECGYKFPQAFQETQSQEKGLSHGLLAELKNEAEGLEKQLNELEVYLKLSGREHEFMEMDRIRSRQAMLNEFLYDEDEIDNDDIDFLKNSMMYQRENLETVNKKVIESPANQDSDIKTKVQVGAALAGMDLGQASEDKNSIKYKAKSAAKEAAKTVAESAIEHVKENAVKYATEAIKTIITKK